MLLAIDIGNSNIKCGLFRSQADFKDIADLQDKVKPVARFKIPSKQPHSVRGLYEWLCTQTDITKISSAIFSTVVPSLKVAVEGMLEMLDIPYLQLTHQLNIPITVDNKPPKRTGTDLLSNTIAAHYLHPNSHKVIISFGTALTFTSVSRNGDLQGCAFAAGLGTSFRALLGNAALLNDIELTEPQTVNGKTTEEALQAGFIFGFQGMVKEIAKKMAATFEDDHVLFITNGYEATLVKPDLPNKIFDSRLTLKGLYFAARDNGLLRD